MTREEAIIILDCERPYGNCGCGASDEEIEKALNMAIQALEQEPKTGYWIYKPMKGQFCSECDESCIWKFNYCPNCGTKMIEPQESKE